MNKYIAFDIGGTNVKYGIIDECGNIIKKDLFKTKAKEIGGLGIINEIIRIVNLEKYNYETVGVAISSHGMIDSNSGLVLHADDHLIPGYSGLNVKKMIQESCNLSCEIENDVNCAGLGELWLNSDISADLLSMVAIGTGIGACIIKQGEIISGASMCAGEIGKSLIPGGRFEELASSRALIDRLENRLELDRGNLDGRIIFERVEDGDEVFIEELDIMIHHLAVGLSNLCLTLNPGLIILGGGIMSRSDYFLPRLKNELKKLLPKIIFDSTELRFAKLQNDAGMVGAVKNFINRNM